jgi:hypothetical protein
MCLLGLKINFIELITGILFLYFRKTLNKSELELDIL